MKKSKIPNIIYWILTGLIGLIAISYGIMILCGYRIFAVVSGSMEPELPVNSIVLVKKIDSEDVFKELKIGDDITYKVNKIRNTHRIITMSEQSQTLQTQSIVPGATKDAPIKPDQVIGKVVGCVPSIGSVLILMGNIYFIFAIVLLIVIVIVVDLLIKEFKKKKVEN